MTEARTLVREALRREADLEPPLGYPGGPCHVVRRIDDEVRNDRLKNKLVDMVEKNRKLTNPDAAKIYDLEAERGVGIAKKILIGPHAQYRMDLRQVMVPQVRATLKTFSKLLNDWKSQKSPKYEFYAKPLSQGQPVSFTEPKLRLTIVFVPVSKGTIKLITAYWEGEPDPKSPGAGCEILPERVAARWISSRG